jgi:hypothetical protein
MYVAAAKRFWFLEKMSGRILVFASNCNNVEQRSADHASVSALGWMNSQQQQPDVSTKQDTQC